jgi:hypothetical protein
LKEKFEASTNGDNFIKASLRRIESRHIQAANDEVKRKNGNIVMKYIDHLKKRHSPVKQGGVSSAAPKIINNSGSKSKRF